ncbi:hypothetical protein [Vibrio owensii]|uniref:hypothetical protein n=1 Tax=Vibrio owensii TaxID=696485 RepID=UPI0018F1765A|nr:hypothetical protein [Vibrio owensii]
MSKNEKQVKFVEAERWAGLSDQVATIGNFLGYLSSKGIVLAKYGSNDLLHPEHFVEEELIASSLGVDMNKVEQERQAILNQFLEGASTK